MLYDDPDSKRHSHKPSLKTASVQLYFSFSNMWFLDRGSNQLKGGGGGGCRFVQFDQFFMKFPTKMK